MTLESLRQHSCMSIQTSELDTTQLLENTASNPWRVRDLRPAQVYLFSRQVYKKVHLQLLLTCISLHTPVQPSRVANHAAPPGSHVAYSWLVCLASEAGVAADGSPLMHGQPSDSLTATSARLRRNRSAIVDPPCSRSRCK